jgi:hypothetical protein
MPDIRVALDDVPVLPESWTVRQHPPGHYDLTLSLSPSEWRGHVRRLELTSPTFVPRDCEPGNADPRELGVLIEALRLDEGAAALKFVNLPVYPSMPLSIGPRGTPFEAPTQRSCNPQTGGFGP